MQWLPAEKKEALSTSPKFVAIKEELNSLRGQENKKSTSRRKKLYAEKQKLADQELREWQKTQPYRSSTLTGDKDPLEEKYKQIYKAVINFIYKLRAKEQLEG